MDTSPSNQDSLGLTRDAQGTVVRSFSTEQVVRETPGPRQRWFRLVAPGMDSHGTRFAPEGGDLSRHRAFGSPWLWGHASSRNALGDPPPPDSVVGRVLEYEASPQGLDVLVEFDEDREDPRALCNRVWDKVSKGLIRGCSVGAIPTETEYEWRGEGKDRRQVPVLFRKWVLVEGSSVIIPSNPQCMILERDAAVAALDAMEGPAWSETDLAAATQVASGLPKDEVLPIAGTASREAAEPRRKEVASVAVFNPAGQLLFGKRRDNGLWTLPGGHLEPGEGPLAGARRELLEESGYDLPEDRLAPLGTGRPRGDDGQPGEHLIHCFRADVTERDGQPSGADDPDREVTEWRWVDPPEDRNVALALLGWTSARGVADLHPAQPGHGSEAAGPAGAGEERSRPHAAPSPGADDGDPDDDDEEEDRTLPASEHAEVVGLHTGGPLLSTRDMAAVTHPEWPTAEGAWDADAAVRRFARWASSDGSGDRDKVDWEKFRQCFALFDDANPGLTAGWGPHHDVRDEHPVVVWRGVVAAAAALQGARGGASSLSDEERAAARRHIAAEYRRFGRRAPWEGEEGDGAPVEREAQYDLSGVDMSCSAETVANLRQGLKWRHDGLHGEGLTEKTAHEAQRLAESGNWWPEKALAARGWFARHGAQGHPKESGGKPTPYGVAWALWGGDSGRREAGRISAALDRQREREVLLHAVQA